MGSSELKAKAREQLRGRWALAVITILVASIFTGLLTSNRELIKRGLFTVSISFSIFYILFGGVIIAGKSRFLLNMTIDKKTAMFTDLFSQFNIYLKTTGLNLLIMLATTIGFFLLIIPGIIISYMYSQAFYILVENPEKTVFQCMEESRHMMIGHKFDLFCVQLSFIGWIILGAITCGIGFLWVNPYLELTCTNFYLSIKN